MPTTPPFHANSAVAYYKFDEGFGTNIYDFSPSKNNGVIAGTTLPTWQSSCAKGKCLSISWWCLYERICSSQ